MPSEPLNWDRKDFYKERRYERSDGGGSVGGGGGGGGSLGRWRDSRHGSRGYARWRTHEFHRHPGHGKQGGYQPSLEETGHGCRLSRSSDRMVEEESCRPSNNWNDRNFGRNNRERRGPGSQSEWQGSRFESGDISANSSGRHHGIIPQRSLSDQLTYLYQQPSDYGNLSSEQINSKNLPEKLGGFEGFGTGRRYNKDSSAIPWKSLKWTRSNSLSSPSSGFNHSSSSKSFREDLDENKPKSLPGKVASVQSPSEYATGDLTYAESYEEMCARKKQRVGWGQGLAKFEKKKVGGSDDTTTKNGLVLPASNTNASHSLAPNLPDRSPNATASPATPSSMSCSSSPGAEYFSYSKVMSDKNDTSYYSPDQGFQNLQGDSDKVEHFELDPTTDLSSSAISLLQPENSNSVDSSFVKSTAINKLLLLKNDVLKALEKTESELELCENQLKALNSETVTGGQYPTASEFPPEDCTSKICQEAISASKELQKHSPLKPGSSVNMLVETPSKICQEAISASKELQKHSPLQPGSSVNMLVETPTVCNATLSGFGADVKDGYVDSPVISTSVGRFISSSSVLKHDECTVATSTSSKERLPMFEKVGVSIGDKNDINESSTSAVELRGPSNSECVLNVSILESNRSSAKKASEIFSKLLSTDPNHIDIWKNISLSCQQNVSLIKEKLAIRKCFMRFKKRVLTLKFKAHRHLWKEDLRLLSIKKNRAKPQKRFESGLKSSNNGSQKHGSSVRSRFIAPGKFGLVPTTEIVDFTSKLLSDSKFKLCRSTLKMPSLILDKRERNLTRFVTSNGLVEDPCAVEKERVMINPWMPEEKEIFMEMLTTYGKDFKKIASFLDHKTTADCVEFYYKNHKSESFDKIKKKLEVRKQGRSFPTNTYLVTSRKEWKPEVNAASLDILGAASMIAANADATMNSQQNCAGMSLLGRYYDYKVLQPKDGLLECSSRTDMIGNGTASAGICGAPSSETTRSNFTSSVDHGEVCQVLKNQKRNCITDQPLTPVTHNIDEEETCSDESSEEMDSIDWNDEEKSLFIKLLRSNGKDFGKISQCIGSKSRDQCKVFFSKARKCLGLELMDLVLDSEGTAVNDIDVGQMDKKEAWVGEIGSPILSTQFCDKMDVDASSSVSNFSDKASSCAEITLTEEDRSEGNKKTVQSDCDDPGNGEFISEGEKNLVQNVEGKLSATAGALHCDDAVTAKAALSCEMPLQLNGSPRLNFDTTAVKEQQDGPKVTPEEFLSSVSPVEHDRSCSSAGVELKAVLGAYTEEITESDKQDANGGAGKNLYRSSSYSVPHSNTPSNVTRLVEETSVPSGFGLTPNYPSQIFLEVLPGVEKSQIMSWQQAESSSMPSNPVLVDSSTSHFEERLHCATSSTFNFETYKDLYDQKSLGQDATQKHLLGHESLSRSASLQNFRGYPQMSKNKVVNMDADSISREKHTIVQYYSRANRNSQSNQRSVQNYSLEKCNGLKLHSVAEFSLQPKSQEHSSSDHRRAHSWSSSDTVEHSKKAADVKLFGQILSPFSPSQSPVPTMNGSFSTTTESSSKSFNLKLADHGRGGTLVPPKLNPSNLSGSDSLPVRSYGYWEGNRIQAGLSSVPDPMVSLTEFPAAVIGGSSSSCGIDKLKINDRNFGCISAKDQGLIGYPMYGSYEGTKTQPFPVVDVKQHVVFSELQKHNGFEAEPSFTGISDPVAAIKMHYATAEKYGGQGQNGTGDIGS